ncbi:hypothetical protein VP01_3134g2 [Puccinia sorghi]|uniref:Uncharacterized protein n=1 Tax=Puccinia sorghi TaxID=27349 RepID=A0A0L6UZ77_9BASI|nr:hypothetical protein VP01_3134g2 [Puccinia sorghi]
MDECDRNCGFRCILAAIEFGKNSWFQVQHELVKEMGEKIIIYSMLKPILSQLKWIEGKQLPTPSKGQFSSFLQKIKSGSRLIDSHQRKSLGLGTLGGNQWIKINPTCHWLNKICF